jgi:hypothetical protein
MYNLINVDISGLSYKHQSGVQNTLLGLVNGYLAYENNTHLFFKRINTQVKS